jgi:hypothetical protein
MTSNSPTDLWSLIESAQLQAEDDGEEFAELMDEALAELDTSELLNVTATFTDALRTANRWDLWGAAYIMNGGCSDDGFLYWRCWLVAQGRKKFELAIADPQALAGMKLKYGDEGEYELENLLLAFEDAIDNADFADEERPTISDSGELEGTEFDFEDERELQKRFPKLLKKFGDN